MLQSDRSTAMSQVIGFELARRQAAGLGCGFSAQAMRTLVAHTGAGGPAWAIGAHRETDKARGAKAFPFRIAAAVS